MTDLSIKTVRTLIINGVTDELFWHVNRRNNCIMGYHGDDAHIIRIAVPKNFTDTLPDHLKSEWNQIVRTVRRSKAHYLEIHPATQSDLWDKVSERKTFEEFMKAMKQGELRHYVNG